MVVVHQGVVTPFYAINPLMVHSRKDLGLGLVLENVQ